MEIVVVTCTCRPSMWANAVDNLGRQTRKPDALVVLYHKVDDLLTISGFKGSLELLGIHPTIVERGRDDWNLSEMMRTAFPIANKLFIGGEGLFAIMDDDDIYGAEYLAELEEYFHQFSKTTDNTGGSPVAMYGKADVWVKWPERKKMKRFISDSRPFVNSVAGSSISVDLKFWREHPAFRHDQSTNCADTSIIEACHRCRGAICNTGPANYFIQRFGPQHQHGWIMPEPTEEGMVDYE